MKLLLYCTKAKPYLYKTPDVMNFVENFFTYSSNKHLEYCTLNGTIPCECDFEVEEIVCDGYAYLPLNSNPAELETKRCLTEQELENYFTKKYGLVGYAIHIKNLHIFDEPKELSDYYKFDGIYNDINNWKTIDKAPQNMMSVYDSEKNHYILISIQPQWLCKILNGEKTVEVRKKILNCMEEVEEWKD